MEEIWLKFEHQLHSFILSKVKDEAIAADLLQELFIRIHANIGKLHDQTKLQSWIYQICRNLITDHFRIQQKERQYKALVIDSEFSENEENFMSESIEDMIKMMNDLPSGYCEVFCLTELGGLS